MKVSLVINEQRKKFDISPAETLLDLLRRNYYTEVKRGCNQGECGACLVLLDGKVVNSCQVLAGSIDGCSITTVRGIGTQQKPSVIQQSLAEVGAVQCGFCTPGIVIAVYALLRDNPSPSEQEIRKALDGNLCRCTGYEKIVAGIQLAAERL
jgi:carbon-monoxide dehydrogenase small subunit